MDSDDYDSFSDEQSSEMPDFKRARFGSPPAKATAAPTDRCMITFVVVDHHVSLQVASSHSLQTLAEVFFENVTIGDGSGIDGHMWHFSDLSTRKTYVVGRSSMDTPIHALESLMTPGGQLQLSYDYGSTTEVLLTVKSVDLEATLEEINACPRLEPNPAPAGFVPHDPGPGTARLDDIFPDLSKFIFKKSKITWFLGQPGKKKIQCFIDRYGTSLRHLIFVPDRFKSVEDMFFALNEACRLNKPAYSYDDEGNPDHPLYNWYGVTLFPPVEDSSPAVTKAFDKYSANQSRGLAETARFEISTADKARIHNSFSRSFPKCTANLGFSHSRSTGTERGWIIFNPRKVVLCRGEAMKAKPCRCPTGAFNGLGQQQPTPGSILRELDVRDIKSLHELFCIVEGLWP